MTLDLNCKHKPNSLLPDIILTCGHLSSPTPGGPVLTPSFPQMQVQQLLQMKKQQQQAAAVQAAAAAQQKAGQPQQGQATMQQKVAAVATLTSRGVRTDPPLLL